ncbi:MAG TPA: hypothetical protein VJN70_12585 [Gemmatimonadaceae bacterium]|nr:hypothetical protein [Gemmatimonadaceae bacterium]
MSDDDEIIIVCLPIADLLHPAEGSTIIRCHACDQQVWQAPSSKPIAARGAVMLCVSCSVARMRAANESGDPVTFVGRAPGALDELTKALTDDAKRRAQ